MEIIVTGCVGLGTFVVLIFLAYNIESERRKFQNSVEEFVTTLDQNNFKFSDDRLLNDLTKVFVGLLELSKAPSPAKPPIDFEKEYEERWLRELEECKGENVGSNH